MGLPAAFFRVELPLPHLPGPLSWSLFLVSALAIAEGLTIGLIWWSYQPSESSYEMMMAVLRQNFDFWIALIVVTRNCCSSSGSEYPAWPSIFAGALRKLTAGRLSALSASKKSWM